jgi:pSer/pThr/pTyr-binding forkhead associated (FHA) protein
MARLVVLSEGYGGKSYELKVERTTVGRLDDNAFQIPDPSVSSHHCEVVLRGNDIVIIDLNSTNGTFVNGEQVTSEAVLQLGQIVRLGQIDVRLEVSSPTGKKQIDKTVAIGVKANQLDTGTKPVSFNKGGPFQKKTNKFNKIIIVICVVLVVVIIAALIFAFVQFK